MLFRSHGSPTVKYRGIFFNDEQPALQNWAMEKFTNGTGAPFTGSPFNHFFYTKVYERFSSIPAWQRHLTVVVQVRVDPPHEGQLFVAR